MKLKHFNKKGKINYTKLLLQLGLAVVFIYAGISELRQPQYWLFYFPATLPLSISIFTLIKLTAFVELLLALWILRGTYLKYAGFVSALLFATIILVNFHQFMSVFRDMGLVFMALALASLDD